MKIAVDSSVLLDVFGADPQFGLASQEALRRARADAAVVACEVVWAEVRAHFHDDEAFHRAIGLLGIRFEAIDDAAAVVAGPLRRDSRRQPSARERVVADFLIGAHATAQADARLTRDHGFYRHYCRVDIVDPSRKQADP